MQSGEILFWGYVAVHSLLYIARLLALRKQVGLCVHLSFYGDYTIQCSNNGRNWAISGEGAVADPLGWRSVWLLWKWSNVTWRRSSLGVLVSPIRRRNKYTITRSRSAVATHTHAHTQCGQGWKRFHSVSVHRVQQKRWDDWNHVHCIVRQQQHRDPSVAALQAYLLNGTIEHSDRLTDASDSERINWSTLQSMNCCDIDDVSIKMTWFRQQWTDCSISILMCKGFLLEKLCGMVLQMKMHSISLRCMILLRLSQHLSCN